MSPDHSDWVHVASFSNPVLAHVLLSRLQDEGIECRLLNEHTNQVYGQTLGEVEVQVRAGDLPHAKRILEEADGA